MSEYTRFRVVDRGDVLIVRLLDPTLFDTLAISELEEELLQLLGERSPRKVLVSFAGVIHCSTAVINGLLRAKKKLVPAGGQLKLCAMTDTVREAYRILNLEGTVFEIYDSEQEALESLGVHV